VGYFGGFLAFVIQIIFGLLIFMVMLRLIMQMVRADFYNPVGEFVMRLTGPMLKPFRRFIPGVLGIDMAAVVLLIILQLLEIILTHALPGGPSVHNPLMLLVETVGQLVLHAVWLFYITVFAQIIMSWINPMAYHHPVGRIILQINAPLMRPAQKILPPLNGIDLSPILVFIFLAAIMFLVGMPLVDLPHRYY
jgi:YggT family protein